MTKIFIVIPGVILTWVFSFLFLDFEFSAQVLVASIIIFSALYLYASHSSTPVEDVDNNEGDNGDLHDTHDRRGQHRDSFVVNDRTNGQYTKIELDTVADLERAGTDDDDTYYDQQVVSTAATGDIQDEVGYSVYQNQNGNSYMYVDVDTHSTNINNEAGAGFFDDSDDDKLLVVGALYNEHPTL